MNYYPYNTTVDGIPVSLHVREFKGTGGGFVCELIAKNWRQSVRYGYGTTRKIAFEHLVDQLKVAGRNVVFLFDPENIHTPKISQFEKAIDDFVDRNSVGHVER